VDYLWFVGDYASYHPLVASRTQEMARLLHKAGVNFGILYEAEKNSGNDIRRLGEEGLFEELATENIAALSECTFNAIVTTDPHTLNTLTNEYPALGLDKPVVHYTQLLHELVEAGRLPRRASAGIIATYHDPCYLGRYNGRYDAPRSLIGSQGYRLHDMGRCRENSFCCGAGGGRIFMNTRGPEERPSENRIREAMTIPGVALFVVACPKDLVMYTAAAENLGVADRLKVVEITDLFAA
jgi:Fe-S oxidoreductase